MQLVVGGAYAGKRQYVKTITKKAIWYSAYTGQQWYDWKQGMKQTGEEYHPPHTAMVLEGWEQWIRQALTHDDGDGVRIFVKQLLQELQQVEAKQKISVILIMLEVGRGIVPANEKDRLWRDVCGWVVQDAAHISETVTYVWNGLSRTIKS